MLKDFLAFLMRARGRSRVAVVIVSAFRAP